MFRKVAITNLSLIILLIGVFGCSSQPTATAVPPTSAPAAVQPTNTKVAPPSSTQMPTTAPAAATPTQAASTSGKKLYACSLFSQAEAESILGGAVENVPTQSLPHLADTNSSCIYQVQAAPGESVQLDVTRAPTHDSARQYMEESKTVWVSILKAEPEVITGLGDEAFWLGNAPSRQLHVLQDIFYLRIENKAQVQDAQLEQLVKKMLGHMDDVFIVPPPSATTAQQPTGTPAGSGGATNSFDGEWKGTSSNKNSRIGFTVSRNEIASVNVDFQITSGPCQGLSGGTATGADGAPIQDQSFVAHVDSGNSKLEFKGTFQSATQASGTFHLTGKSSACGNYELDADWTAIPASAAEATAAAVKPTTSPTASTPTGDACAIFRQADLEAYLGKKVKFFSDDARGWAKGGGKVSRCEYVVVGSPLEGSALVLRDMSSAEEAKTYYEQVNLKGAKDLQITPEAVAGVGDEAHWLPGLEFFTVRSGKYVLLLVIAGQTGPDAKLQTFVKEMLERLPQ